MNCPICDKIMEQGFVQAGGTVTWVKKKHKISLWPGKGETMLGRSVMGYCAIPAYICKDCKNAFYMIKLAECEVYL